jgi:ribosome assembly protein 1
MCIKDLRERFARIDIHVSPPLVAFRESVFLPSEMPDVVPKPPKVGHFSLHMRLIPLLIFCN